MKILIATPLYPPDIGGPATYAKVLEDELLKRDIDVVVVSFHAVRHLPKGLSHLAYLLKLFRDLRGVNTVLSLDPTAIGLPVVIATFLRKTTLIVRIGGDSLWEQFINRTGSTVPLSSFYQDCMQSLSLKEKIFFTLTRFTLSRMDVVCFSTEWQREIWCRAYGIPKSKTHVVENALPMISEMPAVQQKKFLWAGRDIPLKNLTMLRDAFAEAAERAPDISLEIITGISHEELVEKIKTAYVLLLPSLTDISPNFILEGVSYGKPFVMTSETGVRERLHGLGIFIDPQNKTELVHAILDMTDPEIYEQYRKRIREFPIVRTYADIADEFIGLMHATK